MTSEKSVKDAVKRRLKKAGAWYTMPYQSGYSQAGVPDFIVCHEGLFWGIECKFGRNKPTPRQEEEMRRIREAGGRTLVINETNIDEVERVFYVDRTR